MKSVKGEMDIEKQKTKGEIDRSDQTILLRVLNNESCDCNCYVIICMDHLGIPY